jgi:hypothetical protein
VNNSLAFISRYLNCVAEIIDRGISQNEYKNQGK